MGSLLNSERAASLSISAYSIGISRLPHQCVFVHGAVILQNNEGTCDVKVLEQGRSEKCFLNV